MTTKTVSDEARARAEARFKLSEERRTEAEKVMQDLREAKDAESEKTTRLRALRLAKEEADRAAVAAAPKKPAGRRKASTTTA